MVLLTGTPGGVLDGLPAHVCVDADWTTERFSDGTFFSVEDFRPHSLSVFSGGALDTRKYEDTARYVRSMRHALETGSIPEILLAKCRPVLTSLHRLLERPVDTKQLWARREWGVSCDVRLSESQHLALRSALLGNARLAGSIAALDDLAVTLDERTRAQTRVRSCDTAVVPRDRPLYLTGTVRSTPFNYTVHQQAHRLRFDDVVEKDAAVYALSRIPAYISRSQIALQAHLLSHYAGIKRHMWREGLTHYPVLR